jgi:hypothetical protein
MDIPDDIPPDKGPHGTERPAQAPGMQPPPILPINTQCRLKAIRLPGGQPLVAVTMLTALGSSTYFFEPEVMARIAEGMIAEGKKANNMPIPVVKPGLIVPENN